MPLKFTWGFENKKKLPSIRPYWYLCFNYSLYNYHLFVIVCCCFFGGGALGEEQGRKHLGRKVVRHGRMLRKGNTL